MFHCSAAARCQARTAIRKKYNIEGNCCVDCLTVWYIPCCSLIQVSGHFAFIEAKAWKIRIDCFGGQEYNQLHADPALKMKTLPEFGAGANLSLATTVPPDQKLGMMQSHMA
jgi:hypothetical protein